MHQRRAFTLIEIIIVVAIIGILMVTGFTAFISAQKNQELSAVAQKFATVVTTAHIYARENKDIKIWGVRGTLDRYALISATTDPLVFDIEKETALPAGMTFTAPFTIYFDKGTGTMPTTQSLILKDSRDRQMRIDISPSAAVDIVAL
ncbi:prepilin-type N-terminal cleavage/methylation domain-containing protein [Candidatus Microgenomates bacterium]|nr:MAG: prepilin-type N-terminal cleavage/methylation domain-containing protein [Candidatus Microgenomates bacterium]